MTTVDSATAARHAASAASITTPSSGALDDCSTRDTSGTSCQPGNDRKVPGGGRDKVSHKGWPAVTGIFWMAKTAGGRTYDGTAANDELLSHGASDTINGLGGNDIIWGDYDPVTNPTGQHDRLNGGDGDDYIYTSHGTNTVTGGRGNDFIYAYYGHGTIDCGPGYDTVKIHLDGDPYRIENCERILNFCAFGSIDNTRCAKPGEKKAARTSR
jgi:Ca2+-binding RTX toxin-like protein